MKRSTTLVKRCRRLWAAAFWLIVWQVAAMAVGQRLLLASPVETLLRLLQLIRTAVFWQSALFSMGHILLGFGLAVALSITFSALAARFTAVRELLSPPLAVIRSVPVASFVIVALIWIPSRRLSVLISFLIALPVLYEGVLAAISRTDPQLLEMAHVFRMSPVNRLIHLYLPAVLPHFRAAAVTAMGLAWKSGVAAEVIGVPGGSIGENLYKAKVYLATPDLFAWTLTIVLLSLLCTRALSLLLDLLQRRLERM